MPVKLKLMHVKKFGKIACENTNFSSNTIKFVPVKMDFLPVKKTKKKEKQMKKMPVKNKNGREKTGKQAKTWAWNCFFAREKNEKRAKNGFHGHFWFSRGKKTTLPPPLPISFFTNLRKSLVIFIWYLLNMGRGAILGDLGTTLQIKWKSRNAGVWA